MGHPSDEPGLYWTRDQILRTAPSSARSKRNEDGADARSFKICEWADGE